MAYKCGYSGGLGGTPFDDLHAVSAAGGQSMIQRLLRIRVYWGLYIDLIITTYQVVSGPFGQLNVQNGGNGGGYYPDIPMGGDEFIIGIYDTFGNYVDSITQIKTNLKNNVLTNTIGEGGGTGQF